MAASSFEARAKSTAITVACLATALGLGACGSQGPVELGGRTVTRAELERGREVYAKHCRSCHGEAGRGDGPAAKSLAHRPRDFHRADFVHKSTPEDTLPTHQDLVAVIRDGVPDSDMPGWSFLSGEDLDAVANFIKTFSPRWLRTDEEAAKEHD